MDGTFRDGFRFQEIRVRKALRSAFETPPGPAYPASRDVPVRIARGLRKGFFSRFDGETQLVYSTAPAPFESASRGTLALAPWLGGGHQSLARR